VNLQTVSSRANLPRDAALALTVESAKESDLPGLIAAPQVTLKDLQLLAPEQRVRGSEIVSMLGEWTTDRLSAP
jgi:hypothetical protein